jgi:hypothetical protein
MVADARSAPPFQPFAYYNRDGDCIEFRASDESFFAERVDHRLTVFYGQESGEMVGSLIKGVKGILKTLSKSCPGFYLEVHDGRVKLRHLVTATLWTDSAPQTVRSVTYHKLRTIADEVECSVPECPAEDELVGCR